MIQNKILDYEKIVLSGLLQENCDRDAVMEILTEGCFSDLQNLLVFKAVKKFYITGKPISFITIVDEGISIDFSYSLANYFPISVNIVSYAKKLALWHHKIEVTKQLGSECAKLIHFTMQDEQWEATKNNIISLLSGEEEQKQTDYTIEQGLDKLSKLAFETNREPILFSGIPALDEQLAPCVRNSLIVIGALTSMGKTALTLQMSLESAKHGSKVGFISMETPIEDLIKRCITTQFGLPGNEIAKGDTLIWEKLLKHTEYEKWLKSNIMFTDKISDFSDIEVQIRRWQRKHETQIVVIDYLGLINPIVKDNQTRDIEEKTRRLKVLAMELGIVIILLAQLNRESVKAGRQPRISDLRGSASLEHDADMILLLTTPDHSAQKQLTMCKLDCKYVSIFVGKCRTGPRDFCLPVCVFDGLNQRITQL